ncbi:PotD/PotF family extracellular solute-binding protein [Natribaculum luteum]|uniref:PotD/PotF family extracellular solute-binding protein n=1 Tax=Natribaculum luteum TaxID=1586232 RepID=A0ABD5P355_9EURY|nr:extracellular solute-binding protein [Natribaculum luteum]
MTTTIGLAGCMGGSGDDYIRYLGWGGNTQDSAAEIFERWSEESDVEVRHESAGGDAEMISYFQQNRGDVDLCLLSSYGVHLARQEDLLSEVDYSEVPNYGENMKEEWQDMPYIENDAFFRDALTQGYSINTNEVDQEMASWQDIKADEFDGELALRDAAASRFTNAALAIGEDVNAIPDDDELFDDVVAELEAQHANAFGLWGAGAEAMQYLREENAMVAEAWGGRTRALQQDGYEHIEYIIPEEGAATITEDFVIPADSEKKETVYDLLDFVYQRENLVDLSDMLGYPIPVVDTPDVITNLPDYVDDPDDLAWVDWSVVDPVLDDWQETFDQVK